MVCPSCGARNPEQLATCRECGRGLLASDDSQTVYVDETADKAAAADAGAAMTWGSLPSQVVPMPSTVAPGTTFGRYRIESLLGEGGMGAVYKAYDTELNRTVALKLVRPEFASNRQTMERFKQELLLASRISHKNILRIHDLGDANGVKFITMAFVEGADLAGVMARGRLPIERALRYTRQLCAALEAAHAEGVVHRDLKPQNILVDGSDNLYVSDFGLAKSLEAEISMGTRTGQILGTPRYMSPEQVEAKDVDHRSDLYSAGMIVYEMFTGELPFRGDSAMQLMYQRVSEPPRDPRSAVPGLPDYIANIILKCLAKDPAQRYQNAREILADLDAEHAPAIAQPGGNSISIQIRKPTRRGALWTLGIAAAVLAVLLAVPPTRNAIRGLLPGGRAGEASIQHYIAVRPLNVVGDESLKYIAEGVGDSLSAKLSGLRNVYVADSAIVGSAAAAAKQDDAKLAKAVGVTIVVKGTLQASADRVAIAIRVEDVKNKRTLLNREFAGVRQDLLTLEGEIFNALADALAIKQSTQEQARTAARPTQEFSAYDLYLRGVSLLHGKRSAATAQQALDLFEQATKIDAAFAFAYTGIADACMAMWRATKEDRWTQQALSAAEQAGRLNDNLPQAHYALGTVYAAIGRTSESIAELKRALSLAPNSDEGLRRLGVAYRNAGQQDQAAAAYEKASQVNPYYWNNYNLLGGAYFRLGENAKALAAYRRVVELDPTNAKGWGNMASAHYRLGNWNECIPEFEKAAQLDPAYNANLGVAYFFLGRYPEAVKAFETAVADSPGDPTYMQSLADAYRWSGQPDKAAATYDRAIEVAFKALKTDPKSTEAMGVLAGCFAHKGDATQALQFIQQARQIDAKNNDLMYREAAVHAIAGRMPEAIVSLRAALVNGYSLNEAKADPELKDLRQRPEFSALLSQLAANPPH
jgi:tetratricopeptide (TPR) repeat protein